jgi:hypothetical protein
MWQDSHCLSSWHLCTLNELSTLIMRQTKLVTFEIAFFHWLEHGFNYQELS